MLTPNRFGRLVDSLRASAAAIFFGVPIQVPWSPAMVGATSANAEWFETASATSLKKADGTQAAIAGDAVATIVTKAGNGRDMAGTGTVLGATSDASPSGVVPVLLRGGTNVLRGAALGSALSTWTMFCLSRFKAATNGGKYVVSDTSGANVYHLTQSTSATTGLVAPFTTTKPIETNSAERVRMVTQRLSSVAGAGTVDDCLTRLNGSELPNANAGAALASGISWLVGNNSGSTAGALIDLFAFVVVPSALTRANEQRMEGYLAWAAGLQATALDASHPYRNAPPMVPAGTTSTLDWLDVSPIAAQTFLGQGLQIQLDSFNGGATTPATDSTTDTWGAPFSLTVSERARAKGIFMPGNGRRTRYHRASNGLVWRGFRNIDQTSGLAKNLGERFPGNLSTLPDYMANVYSSGGGDILGYWSPAPHWKTTSAYAKGGLWAGGSNARSVRLDDIRTSDPTGYATQVGLISDAMLDDCEWWHQNVGRVVGFDLSNEGLQIAVNTGVNYGTCTFSAAEYKSILAAIIPKIRNSTILSTWNGQPNAVMILGTSQDNFAAAAGTTFTDTTPLSTGKSIDGETFAYTGHAIAQVIADPDWIRKNMTKLRAQATYSKGIYANEYEYSDSGGPPDGPTRFAFSVAQQLHWLNLGDAPIVHPIIANFKQVGQQTVQSSTIGYAQAKVRLPAPYDDGSDTSIAQGTFDTIPSNFNAAICVGDNIPWDTPIYKVSLPPSTSKVAAVACLVAGKLRILIVNFGATSQTFGLGLNAQRTMNMKQYDAVNVGIAAGQVSGYVASVTIPAYTAFVLTEA